MVKHIQTISWQQPTNFLGAFDHFWESALKGLIKWVVISAKLQFSSYYLEEHALNTVTAAWWMVRFE